MNFRLSLLFLISVIPALLQSQENQPVVKVTDSTSRGRHYVDSTTYLNGLKHGRSALYENDVLILEQIWASGQLHGKSVAYRNGSIQQIDHFNQGIFIDTTYEFSTTPVYYMNSKVTYYPNGRRKMLIQYAKSSEIISRTFCNPVSGIDSVFRYYGNGRIKNETRNMDKAMAPSGETLGWNSIKNYYPSGVLKSTGLEKSTSKEGEWIYYDTSGILLTRIGYANNEPHGWYTSYYPDSTVQLRTFCYKAYTDTITVYNPDGLELARWDSLFDVTIESQQKLHYEVHFRNPNTFSPRNLYNRDDSVYVTITPEGGLPITKRPSFPGGMDSLNSFFRRNIVYPSPEKSALMEGTVYIEFVILPDGTLTEVHGHGGPDGNWGLEKEALRVFRLMPKWIPAQYNGKNVKTHLEIAVNFVII